VSITTGFRTSLHSCLYSQYDLLSFTSPYIEAPNLPHWRKLTAQRSRATDPNGRTSSRVSHRHTPTRREVPKKNIRGFRGWGSGTRRNPMPNPIWPGHGRGEHHKRQNVQEMRYWRRSPALKMKVRKAPVGHPRSHRRVRDLH
jgi:hypothetical protein